MSYVDKLYKFEITQIVYVQDKLFFYEKFLERVSEFVHPTIFFFYVIPLLAAFKTKTYTKVLLTAVVTEYLNIALKWLVSAYRPYWWVQETDVYKVDRPFLRQTRLTCETTSGLPSGHLMFSASCLYMMTRELLDELKGRNFENRYLKCGIWLGFLLLLIPLTLSRMYFACHFLHQCICGGVLGAGIAELLRNEELQNRMNNLRKKQALYVAVSLTLAVFVFYWLQKLMGIDPQWSIRMAFKWCENPLFVKADSTPMYGMSRDFGIFFGLALSSPLRNRFQTDFNYKKSFTAIIVGIIFGRFMGYWIPTQLGFILFYSSVFLLHSILPFVFISVVPRFCQKVKLD